jgi:PAS domain S-box-containing protein
MNDWRKEREDNLAELNLGAHILAYLVVIIILITGTSIDGYDFSTSAILLIGTVLPAAGFILLDYRFSHGEYGSRFLLGWNIAKHTLLFAVITIVLAGFRGEQLWLFASMYLLPVVLSCITLGQKWGTVFAGAAVGAIFLLTRGMDVAGNRAVSEFETALVLGGIFFLLAWFLGGNVKVEKETTEYLYAMAEEEQRRHDLIARMMDTSPAGILVLDRHRAVVYANARLEQILGLRWRELQVMFKREIPADSDSAAGCLEEVFRKVFAAGEPVYNYPGTVGSGTGGNSAYLSVSGAPIFNSAGRVEQVVLTVDDITNQKKMDEEMLKTDKLESIGLLAGGIAHDFNNFMAVMLANMSLMKIKNNDQKIAENLEQMEKAVLRARELTRKLFLFTKASAPVRETVFLQNLLLETAGFALSGSAAVCETRIADNLWPVEADEVQIGQVLNNILLNAVQAMPRGGKIELTAANITVGGADQESSFPLPEGEYIRITIADEGTGIPPDQLGKIFDPFYSTKPEGSGLGLAVAYTIIQNHGGLIRVESEPGAGATFHIYLPASSKPRSESPEESDALYFGEGRILIMDDEELIRNACGNMLKHLGYRVSYARDGLEAVRLYQEAAAAGSPFDLVIMDLTIPGGMGGKEAVELLRKLDPAVKTLVSSGYSNLPVINRYTEYGFSGFINKPYRIKELSAALKKIFAN